MRVDIIFGCERLPVIYRQRFVALIKEALTRSNPTLKDFFYDSGVVGKTKPFTFAIKVPKEKEIKREVFQCVNKAEIEAEVFYFRRRAFIHFFVSSIDNLFIIDLYNGISGIKTFEIAKGYEVSYLRASLLPEQKIDRNEVMFKTLSPILLEKKEWGKDRPLLPIGAELEKFNKRLNDYEDVIKRDLCGEGLRRKLEVIPYKVRREVVKHHIGTMGRENGKNFYTFTAFAGFFKVKGDKEDLNFLYKSGIGMRRSQGFGMVDIAKPYFVFKIDYNDEGSYQEGQRGEDVPEQ